jgi:hypothetical protein
MTSALTPTQKAYALLWRYSNRASAVVARRHLYDALSLEERRAAIAQIIEDEGAPSDAEMIAIDMQLGIFPERSFTKEST